MIEILAVLNKLSQANLLEWFDASVVFVPQLLKNLIVDFNEIKSAWSL